MSKKKAPTLVIKSKNPDQISVGANTLLELDGKNLPFVKSYKLEGNAGGLTKLTLEMYVSDVDIVVPQIGDYQEVLYTPENKEIK